MGKAPPPSLCMGAALLPDAELFPLPGLGNGSCLAPRPRGQLRANPAMGAPMDTGDLRGETLQEQAVGQQGVSGGAAQWQGHTATACQAGRRNGRQAACGPENLELFPGCCQLCCKKLLLVAGGGGFTQLDGAGSICSSLQWQQQMPPWLQQLTAAVFPGEERCQEE